MWLLAACAMLSALAQSQDPVKVDPQHYRLEYEDANIRVLHFIMPPGEKSVMHELLERVTVVAKGARLRYTHNDGTVEQQSTSPGMSMHRPAQMVAIENIDSVTYEAVTTEFKHQFSALEARRAPGSQPPPAAKTVAEAKPVGGNPTTASKEPELPKITIPSPAAKPGEDYEKVFAVPQPSNGLQKAFINNAELNYFEAGKGVPVIFVHGVLEDYRSFEKQISALARHFRVITYSRL